MKADLLKTAQRLEDGRMLDRTGDDMAGRIAGEAEEGEVIRFGGTAGEDDLIGLGAESSGDLIAGILQGLAGTPADAMSAGRIAEGVGQVRPHRFPDGGQRQRGSVVVEIDDVHTDIVRRTTREDQRR